jgi:hypothetical protein
VSRLCHRGPGFRRVFATPMLSPGVARPDLAFLGCSPWRRDGPNVACRLLQPISIREHDRRTVRTPRTALMVAHERSCFSNHSLAEAGRIAGGLCASARQPRRHGPGAGSRAFALYARLLPPRSLAVGASPQPDRLGHLMSRARGAAGWRPTLPGHHVDDLSTNPPGLPRVSALLAF